MTGKFDYEVEYGYCVRVDCGQAGVEGYALALLKIFNTARENPKLIYKIGNSYGTDDILVYCPKKSLDSVKDYCNGIHPYYDKANGTVTYVGEVKDVWKCKFALIDYDIDLLDESDDVEDDQWVIRKW
jgi:hypothetical protein